MFCAYFANVLRMFCACFVHVLRMFCACFAYVLRMFCAVFAHVCACFAYVLFFLDFGKFQAVIKSAASAASPKAKSREGSSRGAPGDGARWDDGVGRATDRGAPLELPSLDFAFGEAALAADLITA